MACVYLSGRLLDPEASEPRPGALLLEDGRIAARLGAGDPPPEQAQRVELAGPAIAPGFLDLHFHGPLIFAPAEGFGRVLAETAASMLRHGTTGFLATTVAWPAPDLARRVASWAAAIAGLGAEADPSGRGAAALGLHLEGPWINPAAAGAQPRDGIRPCVEAEACELLDRAEGLVRMVTLAPERDGAAALQRLLARRGVVAALGHSIAGEAEVAAAVDRGARHVTHLFNAMGRMHQRAPGLAGAALAEDRLSCDLICDGAHVAPALVKLAARAKGEQLALITDRVDPPGGPPEGAPSLGAGPVRSDGVAIRSADGSLAGSCLTLDAALRNLRDFSGASPLEAVAACTLRPARVLGLEAQRGTLRPGARADLAILDDALRVRETWVGGRRVYRA